MRIAIDARFINPQNRGLACYTKNLVDSLQKIDSDNKYFILLRKKDFPLVRLKNSNFYKVEAEAHWYGIKEQIVLPQILSRIKPDLTHFPHFNVPVLYPGNYLTTIHDLILLSFPTSRATRLGKISYFIKEKGYFIAINRALQKSRFIISVSQNTKEDILRFFPKIPAKKIKVIYEGAGETRSSKMNLLAKTSPAKRQAFLKKKLGVEVPFLLYFGGAYPHKNLERLVLAFQKLEKEKWNQKKKLSLVLGGGDDFFFQRLKKFIKNHQIKNVVTPGFVKDKKTFEFLYKEACFCIFPSLYEGFGLPPLEALQRKKLVLASNSTSFPEILGNGAIYFDAKNINSIAQTIKETFLNKEEREKEYLPRASQILRKYHWEKTARETLKLYEKSAASKLV